MILLLESGYPFPCPENFDPDTYDAREYTLDVKGVVHFEWLHTLTIEFKDYEAFEQARVLTDWDVWSRENYILEARVSVEDGYNHPAIIVKDKAYCGFILLGEES